MRNIFIALFCLLFAGCVKINLKSQIPPQNLYSIDGWEISPSCQAINTSLSLSVNVLSPYNSKNIVVLNKDKSINFASGEKWIDLPNNMIRNAFIKIGLNNCIQILPSSNKKLKLLKVSINDMYIYNNGEIKTSRLFINYELLDEGFDLIKNGVVIATAQNQSDALSLQENVWNGLQKVIDEIKPKL